MLIRLVLLEGWSRITKCSSEGDDRVMHMFMRAHGIAQVKHQFSIILSTRLTNI